jgi:hypothetical protein
MSYSFPSSPMKNDMFSTTPSTSIPSCWNIRRTHRVVLRHLLRRAHHHRARQLQHLRHRQRHIARPRRQVDDEVVQLAPVRLLRNCLNAPCAIGPRQISGLSGVHQLPDRHRLHAVNQERLQHPLHHHDLLHRAKPQQRRQRRAIDVPVQQPTACPRRASPTARFTAIVDFAHPALARAPPR